MNPERTERDNQHDNRTVFGRTPGAYASGSNGARDNLDLLWSWPAARLRGLARQKAADGTSGFPAGRSWSARPSGGKPALSPTVHEPPRSEAHERAIEFRAEPGAVGLHGSVSLSRLRLRALPHSRQGGPEPGAATAGTGRGDGANRGSRVRRHPAHEPDRGKSQCQRSRTGPAARRGELLHRQRPEEVALRHSDLWQGHVSPDLPRRGSGLLRESEIGRAHV